MTGEIAYGICLGLVVLLSVLYVVMLPRLYKRFFPGLYEAYMKKNKK